MQTITIELDSTTQSNSVPFDNYAFRREMPLICGYAVNSDIKMISQIPILAIFYRKHEYSNYGLSLERRSIISFWQRSYQQKYWLTLNQ